MKSDADNAWLRLSAVHPAMSVHERNRAATRISHAWTGHQIVTAQADLHRQIQRLEQQLQTLRCQLEVLSRATLFQRGQFP